MISVGRGSQRVTVPHGGASQSIHTAKSLQVVMATSAAEPSVAYSTVASSSTRYSGGSEWADGADGAAAAAAGVGTGSSASRGVGHRHHPSPAGLDSQIGLWLIACGALAVVVGAAFEFGRTRC